MQKDRIIDYIITHKDYPIKEDGMYRALCVGNFRKDGWLSEMDGENISEYNDRLNETTGIFWMWKNATAEYVGLSHYRRYFCNYRTSDDRSRLDKNRIQEIFDAGYDMILTEEIYLGWSRSQVISNDVGEERFRKAYWILHRLISETHPEYLAVFTDVMNGDRMYYLNMFVMPKKILDQYCEWLFSFIVDAAEMLDVSDASHQQKRTMGFFSETMMTVWLRRQNYRIFSLPHVNLDAKDGEFLL